MQNYTIRVLAALTILSSTLPSATAAQPYSSTIAATGGTSPYAFGIVGGALPPGLALNTGGSISGTTSSTGTFNFKTQATDSTGTTVTKDISLTVQSAVSIATVSIGGATVGSPYSVTLIAFGGMAPLTWWASTGSLPPGLTLSPSGTLSGTPTLAAFYTFGVSVRDAYGSTSSVTYTLSVADAASTLSIATSSLTNATTGVTYTAAMTAGGGTAPYTWSIASGLLPAGISLATGTGVISGTTSMPGNYTFTVQVNDASGRQASKTLSLVVVASLVINPVSIPNATVGLSYSTSLSATGGTAPYSFSTTQGQFPPGISMNAQGNVSGTPTATGSYGVTVQATSADGQSASKPYTLTVGTSTNTSTPPAVGIYGGLYNTSSAESGDGHFGLTKKNSRWFFRDPQGKLFWGLQIYYVDPGTDPYRANVIAKYGWTDQWAAATPGRIKGFGFNSLANDVSPAVTGIRSTTTKLPFSRMVEGSDYAMRPKTASGAAVKNVYAGNTNYTGYLGEAPDMYDPAFETSFRGSAGADIYGTNVLPATPWLIGVTPDDADYVFGIKDAPGTNCGSTHFHAAYMVARANPVVAAYIGPNRDSHAQTYADTKLYTKYAWRDYLKGLAKYQTNGAADIAKLNAAWGSTYTTWDCQNMSGTVCAGTSWGTGTGLLDENGSHSWMGTNEYSLSSANSTVVADLNGFLYEMWRKYAIVTANAIRAYIPTSLVFSPASLGACTRPEILKAFSSDDPTRPGKPLYDVLEIGTTWTLDYSKLSAIYNLTGRPIVLWHSYLANSDSSLSSVSCTDWGQLCLNSQAERGSAYANSLPRIAGVQGANGDLPIIGIRWWQWSDNVREMKNFGLVSLKDNAYDGLESVVAPTPCQNPISGYMCGGETLTYGNFIGAVRNANQSLLKSFETTYWSPAPEPANKAVNKPTSASSTWSDSCAGGCASAQGTDGDSNTRWSSLQTDNEWFQVDLLNTYKLSSVTIDWSIASANAYKLLVSSDGVTWTTVADRSNVAPAAEHQKITDTFTAASARFLKFVGVKRATTWGYSFYEISANE